MSEEQHVARASGSSGGQALIGRARLLGALSVSAGLFYYVGWWAVRPDDPEGPVTLLRVHHGVMAMAELLGLAVVAAGLAVAIRGAGSGYCGPLAIAVGLAVLAGRGTQLESLVNERLLDALSAGGSPVAPFPRTELIAETWLWLALIAVGFVVGRWVEGWFGSASAPDAGVGRPIDSAVEVRQAAASIILVTLAAYNLVRFCGGRIEEATLKGQVYFSVGAAFCISTMLAIWFFHAVSQVWMLVSVALVATMAYGLNGVPLQPAQDPAALVAQLHTPIAVVARPLPIEFASMGVVGAMTGHLFMSMLRHAPRDT